MLTHLLKLVSLALLVSLILSADWQANMFENRSKISTVYEIFDAAIEADLDASQLAPNISSELNARWDRHWNVAVVKSDQAGADAVCYGYAFRGQWLWHNNYGVAGRSYIVWKDYNCVTESSLASNTSVRDPGNTSLPSNFHSNIWLHVHNEQFTEGMFAYTDLWRVAKSINEKMEEEPGFLAVSTIAIMTTQKLPFASYQLCYDEAILYNQQVSLTQSPNSQNYFYTTFRTRSS